MLCLALLFQIHNKHLSTLDVLFSPTSLNPPKEILNFSLIVYTFYAH